MAFKNCTVIFILNFSKELHVELDSAEPIRYGLYICIPLIGFPILGCVGVFNNNAKFLRIDMIFCMIASILGFILFVFLFVLEIHWVDIIIVLIHTVVISGQYCVGMKIWEGVNEDQLRTYSSA
jgi:hypothetical protein